MTDASRHEAGIRLAEDLRRIRESRALTVQDVNNETKIPVSLLIAFEKTALFDHDQFNRVYLRSVVRTYALAVNLPPERAADALEAAFSGTYQGELAREFLGDAPAAPTTTDKPVGPGPAEPRPAVPGRKQPEKKPPSPPAAAKEPVEKKPDPDWSATSPPSARRIPEKKPKPRAKRPSSRSSGSAAWLFVVGGIVVLGALIWLLLSVLGTGERTPRDTGAVVDTAQVEPEPVTEPVETRPRVTLGDVMVFYVVAEHDKLDPVRVTVDDDVRRPYWLEHGDSLRFEAQEQIVFEELLDRVRVTVEGYDFPTDRRDDQGRLVISRETARAFFDRNGPS